MASTERPLSPHLQVYRPQITSILSILHRLTGVVLGGGTLLLAWWLIAAAVGPEAYADVEWFISSWVGRLVLLSFTFCLFYHLCNGIRHLGWDIGWGFELPVLHATGWLVVVAAMGMTLVAWILGYALMP
jgi:succinate dehydrogenase / fumarate reductase cytochrome b subunit